MKNSILLGCICGWLALASTGCGDKNARYIPKPEVAERALANGMDAWKSGQPAGPVDGTSPLVHVTDNKRKPNQLLKNYTILGEVTSKHGRSFVVELEMANPAEKIKAEYLVVGIDPLWVFRREDYELLMHWDHHMPPLPESSPDAVSSKP